MFGNDRTPLCPNYPQELSFDPFSFSLLPVLLAEDVSAWTNLTKKRRKNKKKVVRLEGPTAPDIHVAAT